MIKPILAALMVASLAAACRPSSPRLEVGGIYSVAEGNGRYGVVKLLAYADGICHVRMYKQKFQARPTTVDPSTLSLGKPEDPDGFGIGHVPLREEGFLQSQPVLITKASVTPEELEGYNYWKESRGGAF